MRRSHKILWLTGAIICIAGFLTVAIPAYRKFNSLSGEHLVAAAQSGNLASLKTVLNFHISPNVRDKSGNTPLVAAAAKGYADIVEKLLEKGADVNAKAIGDIAARIGVAYELASFPDHHEFGCGDEYVSERRRRAEEDKVGVTALMAAAHGGHLNTVITLLEHGADLEARSNDGATALMFAALDGEPEMVKTLLAYGAEVNRRSNKGQTAFLLAAWNDRDNRPARYDKDPVLQLLLDAGADVNLADDDGNTPLIGAVNLYDSANAQFLLNKEANSNAKNNQGKTALMFAAKSSYRSSNAKLLIDIGADVNAIDNEGKTALMYSTEYGSPVIFQQLLARGANINARDNNGWTPLMHDVISPSDDPNQVQFLINNGAEVDARNHQGQTALMLVKDWPGGERRAQLLDKGANINAQDNSGKTALMYAARQGYYGEGVKLLIVRGANINLTDNDGRTAIFYAALEAPYWRLQDPEYMFYHLKKAGAAISPQTAFLIAVRTGETTNVKTLLAEGVDAKLKGPGESTFLMYAAEENHPDVVAELIAHGAEINARDKDGKTALMRATHNDCRQAIEVLLQKGADVNLQDERGETAMMIAAFYNRIESTKALLTSAVQFDLKNQKGDTAFAIASSYARREIIQLLKNAGANP